MTKVFVSGATGFIALHTVKQLLEKGYTVVGSVRSEAKGERLVKQLNNANFSYEIVTALDNEGAFDAALQKHSDTEVFLHTASPVTFSEEDVEKNTIIPAIRGTTSALWGVHKYCPNIRNVVVTSSNGAVFDIYNQFGENVYTEKSWQTITYEDGLKNAMYSYLALKKYAEKAAWEFVEKEKPKFKLTVICPVYVFGPQAFDDTVGDTLNFSAEIVNQILKSKPGDKFPEFEGHFIDVRDTAKAHIVAFEKKEAWGERLIVANTKFIYEYGARIIVEEFPQLKGKISLGDENSEAPKYPIIDNSHTRKVLGFDFIPLRQSIKDAVEQILKVRGEL